MRHLKSWFRKLTMSICCNTPALLIESNRGSVSCLNCVDNWTWLLVLESYSWTDRWDVLFCPTEDAISWTSSPSNCDQKAKYSQKSIYSIAVHNKRVMILAKILILYFTKLTVLNCCDTLKLLLDDDTEGIIWRADDACCPCLFRLGSLYTNESIDILFWTRDVAMTHLSSVLNYDNRESNVRNVPKPKIALYTKKY